MVARNHALAVPMHQLITEAVEEKRALIAVRGFRPLPGAVSAVKRFARTSKLAVVTGASTAEATDALRRHRRSRLHGRAGGRRGLRAAASRRPSRTPGRSRAWASSPQRSIAIEDATPGSFRRGPRARASSRCAPATSPATTCRPPTSSSTRWTRSPTTSARGCCDEGRSRVASRRTRPTRGVATIVPRPIAWVSTLNEDGCANLAPFSFFTGVCVRSAHLPHLRGAQAQAAERGPPAEGHLAQHRADGRVRRPRRQRRAGAADELTSHEHPYGTTSSRRRG